MKGKERCKILKEIRREIAASNDIEFITSECRHKGDCAGTCPKCEAELRYLERELEKRQRLGKAVALAGLTVSLTISSVGCEPMQAVDGDMQPESGFDERIVSNGELVEEPLMGDMPLPGETIGVESAEGELIAIPPIGQINEENAMEQLSYLSREWLRNEWKSYSIIENGQSDRVDLYLAEDNLIRLEYDGADALVNVEVIYDYRTEWKP